MALESGAFGFTHSVDGAVLYYSKNDGEWTALTGTVAVTQGDVVRFKGELTPVTDKGIGTFTSTGDFDAEGNVMSLLYGDNFKGQTDLTGKDYAFRSLFKSCANVVSAENLSLPATTLADWCYTNMFDSCTSLITAPALPAKTLTTHCYYNMFQGCTSLTTAPELPATSLAQNCYGFMFEGCTSLTIAPELPATTLAQNCYSAMFDGCTNLTAAPALPATTLEFSCYSAMFYGCTRLVKAPELPAATLKGWCYKDMFRSCIKLNYIKCLATDISAVNCTNSWVDGVASTGTFIKADNATWDVTGYNGVPTGWTVYTKSEWEYAHRYEINKVSKDVADINKKLTIGISSYPVKTNEKIGLSRIYKILIPIDSVENAYLDNTVISETEIVPYINTSTGENYLILKLGSVISSDYVITEAHIIGTGIYSTPDIRYVDSNMYIYPKLPLGIIKDNLQNLIVSYYDNTGITAYRIWFDDYPYEEDGYASLDEWAQGEHDATDWNSYVTTMLNDDNYDGANPFTYTGETFEWNGGEYYLWESDNSVEIQYMLTDTISYIELYEHSLEANPQNHWCPYVAVLTSDKEVYRTGQNEHYDDILVKVEPAE